MLIEALCDYYDVLAQDGKVLPDGYSEVKIHYMIALTPEGKIDELIDCQKTETISMANGKTKEIKIPDSMRMFQRTEKSAIESNIVEHRPVYLFGLNYDSDKRCLTAMDKTNKAKKSHSAFVEANLTFIEGIHSPLVDAFRKFIENWNSEAEEQNEFLLQLEKEYGKSGFAFCLSGDPDHPLHEDGELKRRWEEQRQKVEGGDEDVRQCAITRRREPIARIHNKLKGVYGGLATGNVLIGFNNMSDESYGNKQAYNSNISELAMKKYTEALNYLLSSKEHKVQMDEMTLVFWAMDRSGKCEQPVIDFLSGDMEDMGSEETEGMLKKLMKSARKGEVTREQLSLEGIDTNVDFYILGLKPNSARLSIKFILRRKYADILWNIVKFQEDMQLSESVKLVSLKQIKYELVPPKYKNEKTNVNAALMANLIESILYGYPLPKALLETVVRRVHLERGRVNATKIGMIKTYINRKYPKEGIEMSLEKNENPGEAYLCGCLFAVLEKIQKDSGGKGKNLNRTIKDSYFSAAAGNPSRVFPKLVYLAGYHLKKIKMTENGEGTTIFYERQIQKIVSRLSTGFPKKLSIEDQGRFICGYYQKQAKLYEKKSESQETNDTIEE